MRKIILGNLKSNKIKTDETELAFKECQKILQNDNIILPEIDLVFINQFSVWFEHGIEYARYENHVELFLAQDKPPKELDIKSAILKSCIEFYIDKNNKQNFNNNFLFDIYRAGMGLFYANRYSSRWNYIFTKEQLQFLKNKLKKKQDEIFWWDGDDQFPLYTIWYVAEKIIKETSQTKSFFQILNMKQSEFEKELDKFINLKI